MFGPRTFRRYGAAVGTAVYFLSMAPSARAVEFIKKNFEPFGYHTQEHLWLSAGGTFACAQVYQYYGMDRTAAIAVSAVQIFGLGLGKEFFIDDHPGVNDLIADGLGVALGTVANITIHFGYLDGRHSKESSKPSHHGGDEDVDMRILGSGAESR